MGYCFTADRYVPLSQFKGYKGVCFSIWHAAFVRDDDVVVFPIEDKPSFEMAWEFYKDRILKLESYPVFVSENKLEKKDVRDKEVIRQILGLPHFVFDKLDPERDIISQLRFEAGLKRIKHASYQDIYSFLSMKWYRDDFKLYCLSCGVFFPYEETLPFVDGKEKEFPVFVDVKRLPDALRKIVRNFNYERMIIDFVGVDANEELVSFFKKQDSLSFEEKISQYLNSDSKKTEDEKIYALCLRKLIASIIDYLYDSYSLFVLNRLSQKTSFLTEVDIRFKKQAKVISSYNGDMYRFGDRSYAFLECDKGDILLLFFIVRSVYHVFDPLLLYAKAGLPYPGYVYLKKKHVTDFYDVIHNLPFVKGFDEKVSFLSPKRLDSFYSYLTGQPMHDFAFFRRQLMLNGVIFDVCHPYGILDGEPIRISSNEYGSKPSRLSMLFQKKGQTLLSIYADYCLENGFDSNHGLRRFIVDLLSKKSDNMNMVPEFYSYISEHGFNEGLEYFLASYGMEQGKPKECVSFFLYVAMYPITIMSQEFHHYLSYFPVSDGRKIMEYIHDIGSGKKKYEPSLPYPFVDYGKVYIAFAKDCFSEYKICLCQKKSLKKRIEYFSHYFDSKVRFGQRDSTSESLAVKKNKFVLAHLGLPESVLAIIDPNQDILSQIPFEEGICHLCNHVEPTGLDDIGDFYSSSKAYQNYILSNASLYGMHSTILPLPEYVSEYIEEAQNLPYNESVLYVDEEHISPYLKKMLPKSKKDAICYITVAFPFFFAYERIENALNIFYDISDMTFMSSIYGSCFVGSEFVRHTEGFRMIAYFLLRLEEAYDTKMFEKTNVEISESTCGIFPDYNPRLVYPYVSLGRVFNGYKPSFDSDEIYFCECDRNSITYFLSLFSNLVLNVEFNDDFSTPLILGMTGLPLEVILKYKDYDFRQHTVDEFVRDCLVFKDHICRRCLNVPHAALGSFFEKVLPFKEDMKAELSFASNALAHDYRMISCLSNTRFAYKPDYVYDAMDSKIPYIYGAKINEQSICPMIRFFCMPYSDLKKMVEDYQKTYQTQSEALAMACSIILDDYYKNNRIFLDFLERNSSKNLFESVKLSFTQLSRVREELIPDTIQKILNFIDYLFWEYLMELVRLERRIGR